MDVEIGSNIINQAPRASIIIEPKPTVFKPVVAISLSAMTPLEKYNYNATFDETKQIILRWASKANNRVNRDKINEILSKLDTTPLSDVDKMTELGSLVFDELASYGKRDENLLLRTFDLNRLSTDNVRSIFFNIHARASGFKVIV